MTSWRLALVALMVATGALCLAVRLTAAAPGTVKLACVADTNVSSYETERGFNYGASSHIRLKGIEMLMLARFDTATIHGWKVQRASLYLHADGDHRLKTIGLSTVAVRWAEGRGSG